MNAIAACAYCWHPRWDHGPEGCRWEGMADIHWQRCACVEFEEETVYADAS